MPVVTVGDTSIGQSAAINFYLASELGLLGSSNLEAAQIISIQEHLKELIQAFRSLLPPNGTPTEEILDTWFTGGSTDITGTADGSGRSTRYLPWFAGRIEQTLGSEGFAVGNKLSLADILLYNLFAETLKDEEAGSVPQWRREPFGSKARMDAVLATCPKISASIAAVASNENFQKWLSIRGTQNF